MKKLSAWFAVLLFGYAAPSFAALPTGSSKCAVCVPSFCGGFFFDLTALYWRATAPQLDYALTFPSVTSGVGVSLTNGRYHTLNQNYDWGFKANVGYIFPCSGNDVSLAYTDWQNTIHEHLNGLGTLSLLPTRSTPFLASDSFAAFGPITLSGTATVDGVANIAFVAPGIALVIPFDPTSITAVNAKSKFENHTWDLAFGQAVDVGCNLRLHWFGGLRYAQLEHTLDVAHQLNENGTNVTLAPTSVTVTFGTLPPTTAAARVVPVANISATILDIVHEKSEFSGVGPRFGLDASYYIGQGVGIVGGASAALLIGQHDATFFENTEVDGTVTLADPTLSAISIGSAQPGGLPVTLATFSPAGPFRVGPSDPNDSFSIKHPNETRVAPNMDVKLGINWTCQFCNCSCSKLTIEAGYVVSHYFNVIDRLSQVGVFVPSSRSRRTIDASFDGPYFGVQVNI